MTVLDKWRPLPGERTVGFAAYGGGGGWWLTNYGGVLSEDGTPFGDTGGSYLGLAAEGRQGGTRYFDRIEASGDTYTIYSTNNEPYTFRVPAPRTASTAPSADRLSEKAQLDAMFAQLGLQGLGDWAFDLLKRDTPIESIKLQLYEREEYKRRFPYMAELRKRGRAINEAQAIEFEQSAAALLQEGGITLYDDPEKFTGLVTKYLLGDASLREMSRRIDDLYLETTKAPAEVQAAFSAFYGPESRSAMATYFLDPEQSLPELEKRLAAARVGGEASRYGFDLDVSFAERLTQSLGLDEGTSRQLFSEAGRMLPRLGDLHQRFNDPDDPVTLEDYADAVVLRDPTEMQQITRLLARRRAEFSPVGTDRTQAGAVSGLRQR